MTASDFKNSRTLEADEENANGRQTQYYALTPSIFGGKKDSFSNPNFHHDQVLKAILELSENQDDTVTVSAFGDKTEEIPLDDDNISEDYDYGLSYYGINDASNKNFPNNAKSKFYLPNQHRERIEKFCKG